MRNRKSNEILALMDRLKRIALELDVLENNLIDKIDNGDEDAQKTFDIAMIYAEKQYHEIGLRLHTLGGVALMYYCLHQIPDSGEAQYIISSEWEGIGKWDYEYPLFKKDFFAE